MISDQFRIPENTSSLLLDKLFREMLLTLCVMCFLVCLRVEIDTANWDDEGILGVPLSFVSTAGDPAWYIPQCAC